MNTSSPRRELSPFYQRIRIPGPLPNAISMPLVAGLAFFVPHLATVGPTALHDWSLLLAALIATAAVFVQLATYVLQMLLEQMDWRLRRHDVPASAYGFLGNTLSDRNFLIGAIGFGVLNAVIGFGFGLPYCKTWESCRRLSALAEPQNITILFGYFLAGFVCGLAVIGIVAVCIVIGRFACNAKAQDTFEPKSPDGCAGTSYIGEALVVFSMITLIVGVMISIYIAQTEWTGPKDGWTDFLKKAWMIFPYLMSVVVLAAPAVPVIAALHDFKFHRQVTLKEEDAALRDSLKDPPASATERLRIAARLQAIETGLNELYQVRIWPFSTDANTKYATTVVGSLLVHVGTMVKLLPTWLAKLF